MADPANPDRPLRKLISLLELERVDSVTFVGQAEDPGWGRLYGGHVFAQALVAAQATVGGDPAAVGPLGQRPVHVHQGTFLLPGDVTTPITYKVDLTRDGRSFSSRRVEAWQRGQLIFHAATSFHAPEPGFAHEDAMPEVAPPERVATEEESLAAFAHRLSPAARARFLDPGAFELRPMPPVGDPIGGQPEPARREVWLRTLGAVEGDPALHAALLAYASDYLFFTTALLPHGVSWLSPGLSIATLNHGMWFHAPVQVDEWVLHAIASPWSGQTRGLVQGAFYNQAGQRVASSMQEGLMRQRQLPKQAGEAAAP